LVSTLETQSTDLALEIQSVGLCHGFEKAGLEFKSHKIIAY